MHFVGFAPHPVCLLKGLITFLLRNIFYARMRVTQCSDKKGQSIEGTLAAKLLLTSWDSLVSYGGAVKDSADLIVAAETAVMFYL